MRDNTQFFIQGKNAVINKNIPKKTQTGITQTEPSKQ